MTTKTKNGKKLYLCADGVYRALGPTMWEYRRAKRICVENRNLSRAW